MTETAAEEGPQALVLRSVLTGRPLPGTCSPVRPADLALATDLDGTVRVLDAGLTPASADLVTAPEVPARLVAETQALRPGAGHGVSAVLRVHGPEAVDDEPKRVSVSLQVCGPGNDVLVPLGTTTVVLRRAGGSWVADGPPTELAT